MSSTQGYGATGSQSGPLYGPQSIGLPAIPPTVSLFAGANPAAQTSTPLIAAGVSGQVWVASPPNSTAPGSGSVVPLSVAAKTPSSPPIGEDGLAAERQPVGAVQGRIAVSHDSPSLAVLGSGMLGPSTQYSAAQPGKNTAGQTEMYNAAQTGMNTTGQPGVSTAGQTGMYNAAQMEMYSAMQTGIYNAAQAGMNTAGQTEMYNAAQTGMYNPGQTEMYTARQPQGGMSQQQGFSSVSQPNRVWGTSQQNINPRPMQRVQVPSLHSAPLACHMASHVTSHMGSHMGSHMDHEGVHEGRIWANPFLAFAPSAPSGSQPPPQASGLSNARFLVRCDSVTGLPTSKAISNAAINKSAAGAGPIAVPFSMPPAANQPGLTSSNVTYIGQAGSGPFPTPASHLTNTPPPASPTMIGTSSGQFGQAALGTARPGDIAASPSSFKGFNPMGQDGKPEGGFSNPTVDPGVPATTQPSAVSQGAGERAEAWTSSGFDAGFGGGGGGGQLSSTPIADSVLLGHLVGDEAAPRPDEPLVVNPGVADEGTGQVSHGSGQVSHGGVGQVSRGTDQMSYDGSGQVPSMPSMGLSDDGVSQIPSMPSVGVPAASGPVSSTPISDSVLLGHLMGDDAAPRPDQPLPVILPEAPTSGVPKEAGTVMPHTVSEEAGALQPATGSTKSVDARN